MADEDKTPAKGEDAPTDTAESVQADADKGPEVPPGADHPDAVKRALDAERKAAKDASKRADAAEAKVREYEEANKSELEKLTGKAEKAETAKAQAEAKLLRYEVATTKQVPAKFLPLLTGSTQEELEAQADLILETNPNEDPNPDFDGGPRDPAEEPLPPDQAHGRFLVKEVFGLKT